MHNTTWFAPQENLNFETVIGLQAQIAKQLLQDKTGIFGLDLSKVLHCDSAGLALLIETKKMCQQSNKQFVTKGISTETLALAEFCGVKSILEE